MNKSTKFAKYSHASIWTKLKKKIYKIKEILKIYLKTGRYDVLLNCPLVSHYNDIISTMLLFNTLTANYEITHSLRSLLRCQLRVIMYV